MDTSAAMITIGGRIKWEDLERLCEAADYDGAWRDWVDDGTPLTPTEILGETQGGLPLRLMSSEASYGTFSRLEKLLEDLGLSYVRATRAGSGVAGEVRVHTPKETFWVAADEDGDPIVPLHVVNNAMENLRMGRVLEAMNLLCQHDKVVPCVPPLEIVDAPVPRKRGRKKHT